MKDEDPKRGKKISQDKVQNRKFKFGKKIYESDTQVTVPREFLLDVTMQGVLKDVVVQIEIQSCQKMFITGNSEVRVC